MQFINASNAMSWLPETRIKAQAPKPLQADDGETA
jgi:hypothetical protein